jgi:hypothetical protein
MSYPFEQTKYLCVSSCLIGLSAVVLYTLHENTFSFLLGVLCLTSINHWRKYVENGFRQRIDIAWVILCGLYIGWKTIGENDLKQYLILSLLLSSIFFYVVSKQGGHYWVVFHASLHLYLSFFVPLLSIL